MIPSVTAVRFTGAKHRAELPLLVLGPSLGSSATTLWSACAAGLTDRFDVLGWDLPGHGHNTGVPAEPFSIAELAAGVLVVVDEVLAQREQPGASFAYAGVSVGGAVGLQLLLDAPGRVESAALICTGARIGQPAMWLGRVGQVAMSGTTVMVAGSAERWFADGFVDREPEVASGLLGALQAADDEGYIAVCDALAGFDVRDRLSEIEAPVLAIAGAEDGVAPTAGLAEVADGVVHGRLVELPHVAHLAPAEAPARVAALLREHFLGEDPVPEPTLESHRSAAWRAGDVVRREVLGDEHVDRALVGGAGTRDFQSYLTEHVWGAVWTRPGLDRRSRSMIALAALVSGGQHEELAVHLRAAITNGVTRAEIDEVLLQTVVHCGVPTAGAAFRIANEVLGDL